MAFSVNFNHKSMCCTAKISKERSDWNLPSVFAANFSISHFLPQSFFTHRHVSTHLARKSNTLSSLLKQAKHRRVILTFSKNQSQDVNQSWLMHDAEAEHTLSE
ncbi:MAG: hypothetical protein ABL890_02120 [Candidatus Peribacteraceae bacterium]